MYIMLPAGSRLLGDPRDTTVVGAHHMYKSLYLQVEVARIGIRITVTMTFSTTHGVPLATGCRQVIRKPVRARIDVRAR